MAQETVTQTQKAVVRDEPKRGRVAGLGAGRVAARRGKPRAKILLVVLGLAVAVALVLLYRYYTQWESTDDAQIDGYIYPVSSRVSGYVVRVMVDDNQYVQAGTVLAQT